MQDGTKLTQCHQKSLVRFEKRKMKIDVAIKEERAKKTSFKVINSIIQKNLEENGIVKYEARRRTAHGLPHRTLGHKKILVGSH